MTFCAGKNSKYKNFLAAEIAKIIAEKYSCVAIVTGAVDVVTDGKNFAQIKNGVPEISKIPGSVCMLSGILGAHIGACEDKFSAAVAAVASMGIAGEISAEKYLSVGTGSLRVGIIVALS